MTIVEDRRCHHRRRGHPRRHARRGRAGPDRRAAGRAGVPGHRGRVCRPAGLAGRVRDRRPGRHRGHRQLRRRAWPATSPRPASGSWRSTAPTGRTAAGRASPTRWMRSAPPGPPSPAGPAGAPKGRDGAVEAIRALMVAKRSARSERTQTINQARALIVTGPDDLRARFAGHTAAPLVSGVAALRPRPGDVVGYATRIALRELGRRAEFLDAQLERLDELIVPARHRPRPRPARPARRRPRHRRAAADRRRGPPRAAALARPPGRTCARAAPIPASSGKVTRHRLNPGGDRQANHALWRIVITRMSSHPADPRLRRAAHRGRPVQEGDHPLPEALRRPRGLPPPPRRRADTPSSRGGLTR